MYCIFLFILTILSNVIWIGKPEKEFGTTSLRLGFYLFAMNFSVCLAYILVRVSVSNSLQDVVSCDKLDRNPVDASAQRRLGNSNNPITYSGSLRETVERIRRGLERNEDQKFPSSFQLSMGNAFYEKDAKECGDCAYIEGKCIGSRISRWSCIYVACFSALAGHASGHDTLWDHPSVCWSSFWSSWST